MQEYVRKSVGYSGVLKSPQHRRTRVQTNSRRRLQSGGAFRVRSRRENIRYGKEYQQPFLDLKNSTLELAQNSLNCALEEDLCSGDRNGADDARFRHGAMAKQDAVSEKYVKIRQAYD